MEPVFRFNARTQTFRFSADILELFRKAHPHVTPESLIIGLYEHDDWFDFTGESRPEVQTDTLPRDTDDPLAHFKRGYLEHSDMVEITDITNAIRQFAKTGDNVNWVYINDEMDGEDHAHEPDVTTWSDTHDNVLFKLKTA